MAAAVKSLVEVWKGLVAKHSCIGPDIVVRHGGRVWTCLSSRIIMDEGQMLPGYWDDRCESREDEYHVNKHATTDEERVIEGAYIAMVKRKYEEEKTRLNDEYQAATMMVLFGGRSSGHLTAGEIVERYIPKHMKVPISLRQVRIELRTDNIACIYLNNSEDDEDECESEESE